MYISIGIVYNRKSALVQYDLIQSRIQVSYEIEPKQQILLTSKFVRLVFF